jgi:alkylation response protein AidB-like acyl-CoA dehydrogenase
MSQTDPLLLDVTRKLLHDVADPQVRRGGAGEADRRAAAWQALEGHGLTRAWVPEAAGGSGASIADGFEILTLAGGVALDVPLAETLLAGWLLAAAGLSVPDGKLAPAGSYGDGVGLDVDGRGGDGRDVALDANGRLSGRATAVPFAREVDRLAVLGRRGTGELFVALVDRAACSVRARDNLAGEPRDTVTFDGVMPTAVAAASADLCERFLRMGAVARACQMSGALQAILARSVAYVGERVAFDRPLAKFQVIQHALARLAGEAAVALAASGSAADALADAGGGRGAGDGRDGGGGGDGRDGGRGGDGRDGGGDADGIFLEVASAKIRVGEAAAAGAAIAHQVHGAIGFTIEHPLHLFTQRLWAWRDDFGTETAWAVRLGAHVARRGADALWPMVAAR